MVFEIFAFVSGGGHPPMLSHLGKPSSTHTNISLVPSLSKMYSLPTQTPLAGGIPKPISQFEKPSVYEVRGKNCHTNGENYHANLNFSYFKCKNECYHHLDIES